VHLLVSFTRNLKYLLDLQFFVVDKLLEDGALVPKHVGVIT